MSASITVQGFVATPPSFKIVGDNLAVSNFRLGSSTRRLNAQTGVWETTNTSWYSISCFRDLAINAFASLKKGDPVVLTGQLKVAEWSAGDKSGLDVEITAEAIGHDLRWGKDSGFERTPSKSRGGARDGAEQPEQPVFPDGAALSAAEPAAALAGAARSGGDWGSGLYASSLTSDSGGPTAFDRGIDAATGEVRGEETALLDGIRVDEDDVEGERVPF